MSFVRHRPGKKVQRNVKTAYLKLIDRLVKNIEKARLQADEKRSEGQQAKSSHCEMEEKDEKSSFEKRKDVHIDGDRCTTGGQLSN